MRKMKRIFLEHVMIRNVQYLTTSQMIKATLLITSASLYCAAMLSSLTAATIELPEYGFLIDAIDAAPGAGPTTALRCSCLYRTVSHRM